MTIHITENAERRIAAVLAQDGRPNLMLRIAVNGGGCSGFQYNLLFDDTQNPDDIVITKGDVRVVIDETSLGLLDGSELDYVEELVGAAFQIRNPNASSSCGCGNSFSL
jgi:iron-sulfur cluster insertion protein